MKHDERERRSASAKVSAKNLIVYLLFIFLPSLISAHKGPANQNPTCPAFQKGKRANPHALCNLELRGLAGKVFLNHKSNLKGYSVFKFAKVKSCDLSDLFKTVNKGVSMNEELS